MNCLFLARFAQLGGGELRLQEEIQALRARGHSVAVMLMTDPGPLSAALTAKGIEVIHLPLRYPPGILGSVWFFLRYGKEVAKAIFKLKIDTVIAFHGETLIAGGLAARITRRRLFYRSAGELFLPNSLETATWLGKKIIAFLKLVRPHVLPHSHWQAPHWEKLGLSTTVCLAGVRLPTSIERRKDSIPASFERRNESAPPTVAFVGRFSAIKGPDLFLQALILIAQRGCEFQALIAGDDSFDRNYAHGGNSFLLTLGKLKTAPELAGRVEWVGYTDDIASVFRRASIFVSASRAEMTGNATMEAMLCGLPVVATRTLGSCEIVSDETSGFLVPIEDPIALADAIAKLLESKSLRQRMGEAARQIASEKFSLSSNLLNLCETIERG